MAKEPAPPDLTVCSRFHKAIELIGRRWTGAIVFLLLRSRCRFTTLRAAIPDITDRMLSERLQELEREGVIERTVVPETPVRVEYALTKKGKGLAAALNAGTIDVALVHGANPAFSMAAGSGFAEAFAKAKLKVKLAKAAVKQLKRTHKLKLSLKLTGKRAGAATTTKTKTVRLNKKG